MKVFVRTYGCKTNQYESQVMKELSIDKGNFITEDYKEAELIVINTCAVTKPAERDIYKFVRRVYRENKVDNKKIFVVGCYAEYIKQNRLEKKFFERLDTEIEIKFLGVKEKYNFVKPDLDNSIEKIKKFFGYQRAYVKIQDGCNNFCSYCIIPYVRNKMYSKPEDVILEEIKQLQNNGYKEIVLVGTHIGRYFYKGKDLVDVCEDIFRDSKINLIFSSIEPNEINDKFIEFYNKNKDRIFHHLHIPLQSGDDYILSSMGRKYNTNDYREIINCLRKVNPELIISTDIIVGYPEETKDMFNNTINFVREIKLNWVHVFPYSPRFGTLSYKKYGETVPKDLKDRVRKLCELSFELGEKYYKKVCKVN